MERKDASETLYFGETDVLSADGYERLAVDMFNRGYTDKALVAAVLSLAVRLEKNDG